MSEVSKRILIVEDDVDLAEMLSSYFRVQGFEVDVATWGEDALKQAERETPDLALLDIRLPDFSGYQVAETLRSKRRTRYTPIIFLTEKRERQDKLTGLGLGAADYITKPFDIKELHLRVRNALRRTTGANGSRHAITGLPEREATDEFIDQILAESEWGVVYAGINNLSHFRDKYGFVAADDVLRAVSVILNKGMDDNDESEGFVGHLDDNAFLLATTPQKCAGIAGICQQRLAAAMPYFYPIANVMGDAPPTEPDLLSSTIFTLNSSQMLPKNSEELRERLLIMSRQ